MIIVDKLYFDNHRSCHLVLLQIDPNIVIVDNIEMVEKMVLKEFKYLLIRFL